MLRSERQKRTGAEGARLKEGININQARENHHHKSLHGT